MLKLSSFFGKRLLTQSFANAYWQCYFWVSDGNPVYGKFIADEDRIVSKTYMTRVEGENTRLRHYARKTSSSNLIYVTPNP